MIPTLVGSIMQGGKSPKATGGTITSDATYWYHTFSANGTFTPLLSISGCEVLIVAGGGGGGYGSAASGGGGAGGLLYFQDKHFLRLNL